MPKFAKRFLVLSIILSTVTVGVLVDNAFVDGIKATTGLDSAIYAGNTRSATTFLVAVFLLCISIVPSYLVSKYLTKQLS